MARRWIVPLSEADKALRRTGIGASEVAAILGLDEHRGPIDVWLEKMGLAFDASTPEQEMGHLLEPVIAQMYERRTMSKTVGGCESVRHPEFEWALCTPDRKVIEGPADYVEIKNVGIGMCRAWGPEPDGVPASKIIQVQWQAFVLDARRIDVAALLTGTRPRVYPVLRDQALIDMMVEPVERFWRDNVLAKVAPPCEPSDAQKLAAARYREHDGDIIGATPEAETLARRLERLARAEKRIKAIKDAAQAAAKEIIGHADGIDGCFLWREQRGKVAWAKVASEVGVPQDVIEKHRGKPARVFKRWNDKNGVDDE